MNKINIKFVSDETLETIKNNSVYFFENITLNKNNNSWLSDILPDNPYVEKNFQINDFNLSCSNDEENRERTYKNAIKLYEELNHLPRRIVTDERFWLWLYLDKFYSNAVQEIKLKSETTFENHWTFKQGKRRGLFFGTLSRLYFRVERTIDYSLDDKYELTKYIFERPERFRTLSWRTFSNRKKIVLGTLKAQKRYEKDNKISNNTFNLISKRISRYGSVNLLDLLKEEEVSKIIYDEIIKVEGMQ